MRQKIGFWIPAAFCCFISFMALFAPVLTPRGIAAEWWRPAFFAFLPMCFLFVGFALTQMHRELGELRQRLLELEQKKPA